MAIQRRELTYIPKEVDLNTLVSNGKLYSDDQISALNKFLPTPGCYVNFIDETGRQHELKFTIFNAHQHLFALHPRSNSMRITPHGSEKLALDLKTGEWVALRSVAIDETNRDEMSRAAIDAEMDFLQKFNRLHAIFSEPLFIPAHAEEPVNEMEEFSQEASPDEGQYYFFTKLNPGMNLQYWMHHHPALSPVVKLNIAVDAARALQRLHEQGVFHCNINLSQLKFDYTRSGVNAVSLVDFDQAVDQQNANAWRAGRGIFGFEAPEVRKKSWRTSGEYSEKSDTYALGVTLGLFLDLLKFQMSEAPIEMIESEFSAERDPYQDLKYISVEKNQFPEVLRSELVRLIFAMKHHDADERPPLQEVIDSLKKIRHKLGDEHRQLNVCVLDIHTLHAELERGAQAATAPVFAVTRFFCVRNINLKMSAASLNAKCCLAHRSKCANSSPNKLRNLMRMAYCRKSLIAAPNLHLHLHLHRYSRSCSLYR